MAAPEPQQNNWFSFAGELLPWATIFGLCYAAIHYVFKYFSESRDARLKEIVNERIDPIEKKIDTLGDSIYELRNQLAKK